MIATPVRAFAIRLESGDLMQTDATGLAAAILGEEPQP